MRVFQSQIREKYNLFVPINPQDGLPRMDEAFFQRLATISNTPLDEVRDVFSKFNATHVYQTDENLMVDLHKAIESFWKKAK